MGECRGWLKVSRVLARGDSRRRRERFAAGVVGGGSVSALRLPDAPNIMFNDINFLLNGPRFDSRCEKAPSVRAACLDLKKRTIPRRIIFKTKIGTSEFGVEGLRRITNRPGNTNFQLRCATLGK